jgi:hypothetical protein
MQQRHPALLHFLPERSPLRPFPLLGELWLQPQTTIQQSVGQTTISRAEILLHFNDPEPLVAYRKLDKYHPGA